MSEPSTGGWLRSLLPFVVICFGGFMALLDIQIVASSLQNIGGGLSAAQDEISWVQTAYLIAEIIVIPLSGWLTRVFSTRWLFAASAAGFTVTSMLCGLAWDIHSMILFRALQGALGASMVPTMFTSSFQSWHWLFYVNVLPGLAVTILIPLLVDIDKPDLRLFKEADYSGIVLMAISLGTLEYVLARVGIGSMTQPSRPAPLSPA
jgi:MFS transporter, DHA2 family, multidrug resistance protein